jgi:hypothetical protein
MRARRIPVDETVFVAIRKGDGEEWADLSTIAYDEKAARRNADTISGAEWRRRNPVARVEALSLKSQV